MLIFLGPLVLFGRPYYIGPKGNNYTGNGSRGNPWFGVGYAMNKCLPGDTVYALTGTYAYNSTQTINVSGLAGKYIVLISEAGHPDSVKFDFNTYPQSTTPKETIYGLYAFGRSYLIFKDLTIGNITAIHLDDGRAQAYYIQSCHHITFDQCNSFNIAGRGFQCHNCYSIYYINCDAWLCADPQLADPGNAGTGFVATGEGPNKNGYDTILYRGCRGWYCSDQSFGTYHHGYVEWDSCWAFANGSVDYKSGVGYGWKLGHSLVDVEPLGRLVKNCLAVYNKNVGFSENNSEYALNMHVYNNLSIKNESLIANSTEGNGFYIYDPTYPGSWSNTRVYRNNIAYGNYYNDFWKATDTTSTGLDHSYNSWDLPYYDNPGRWGMIKYQRSPSTVNDDDFLALPTDRTNCVAILAAARQEDGSLPDIGDYFKLKPSSDLIDKGIDLGLPYNGSAPDLGAFECDIQPGTSNKYPKIKIISPRNYETYTTSEPIIISTEVSDNGSISKVEFLLGDSIIGKTNNFPWSFNWTHAPVGKYYIRAVATDNEGAKGTSSKVFISAVPGGEFISDESVLFRNPNDGNFYFYLAEPQESNCEIAIVTLTGQVIYKETMTPSENIKEFHLSHISPGIYILMLSGKDIVLTKKFIKI